MDWNAPPPELLDGPRADLVIGADVLYEERNGPALAGLLPRLVAPDGEVLIADPRRPHADALLDPLRAAGWSHAARRSATRGRPDESGPVIRLHRLTPPRLSPPGRGPIDWR